VADFLHPINAAAVPSRGLRLPADYPPTGAATRPRR